MHRRPDRPAEVDRSDVPVLCGEPRVAVPRGVCPVRGAMTRGGGAPAFSVALLAGACSAGSGVPIRPSPMPVDPVVVKGVEACSPGMVDVRGRFCAVCDLQQSDSCARACERGSGNACAILAGAFRFGVGQERDVAHAYQLYGKGCGAGAPAACEGLAELRWAGLGCRQDQASAAHLLDDLCAAGRGASCTLLFHLLTERGAPGAARDSSSQASNAAEGPLACGPKERRLW